jgi:dipeptidyl aminopeptidase/acylaminoacyl peptidase
MGLDYRLGEKRIARLQASGVSARLVRSPDENNWILKPRNSRLWYREVFDWLKANDPI